MKKLLSLLLVLTMAFSLIACSTPNAPDASESTGTPEDTGVSFKVIVTDLEGNETTFDYTSDAATVGDALVAEGLISGSESEYGLYVTTVNGITADWDADQTYWAFYIDGEYAMTGVDATEITEGATYAFVLTGPEETTSDATVLGEGETTIYVTVTDVDGAETKFEVRTDAATVGEALLNVSLIAGEVNEYGLYVTSVNGITADWDTEQAYWAFYINGEYAMTGVDATDVTAGATYSFVKTVSAE